MKPLQLSALAGLLALAACSAATPKEQPPMPASSASAAELGAEFEHDRQAILAMAGEFEVTFRFEETVALQPGYKLHEPDRQQGHELVVVIEDTGTHIALQHILVAKKGEVIKHWRQDWDYQRTALWSYAGDASWERRQLDAARVRGTWAQTVWQVDDSPRYAGIGKWDHANGISTWTSERVWRPLPRREYTTRSDYDVMLAVNRHTITPTGWVQEEDNEKLDRKAAGGARLLAEEIGLNSYQRIQGYDFKPGRDYLARTQDYWRAVRAEWEQLLRDNSRVALKPKVGEERLYEAMFKQADELGGKAQTPEQLHVAVEKTLAPYLIPAQRARAADAPLLARQN